MVGELIGINDTWFRMKSSEEADCNKLIQAGSYVIGSTFTNRPEIGTGLGLMVVFGSKEPYKRIVQLYFSASYGTQGHIGVRCQTTDSTGLEEITVPWGIYSPTN